MSDAGDPLPVDERLYVPIQDGWNARIKTDWDKTYCHAKLPGQDYYHLIVNGEIYLQNGSEAYCLRCAIRTNVATTDRLFWQRRDQEGIRIAEPEENSEI